MSWAVYGTLLLHVPRNLTFKKLYFALALYSRVSYISRNEHRLHQNRCSNWNIEVNAFRIIQKHLFFSCLLRNFTSSDGFLIGSSQRIMRPASLSVCIYWSVMQGGITSHIKDSYRAESEIQCWEGKMTSDTHILLFLSQGHCRDWEVPQKSVRITQYVRRGIT